MLGSNKLQPAGSSWTLKIPVRDIIIHPKYWGRSIIRSDIALLHLQTPVTFSKYVQPICIPEQDFNLEVGSQCWVTGWGQVKQQSLGKSGGVGECSFGLLLPHLLGCLKEAVAVVWSILGSPHTALIVTAHPGTAVGLALLGLVGIIICLLEKSSTPSLPWATAGTAAIL